MADPIQITLYRWAGEKWFLRIGSECEECDLANAQIRAIVAAHPEWPLELEVKPWLNHVWDSLRRGGWHAPVVLVDGRLVSQGVVPHRAALEAAIQSAIERRKITAPARNERDDSRIPIS